jgi:hypothetical protein
VDGRLVAAALKMEELAAAGYEWLTQLHANKMNSATGVAAGR